MEQAEKVRENRLRRMAERQGFRLQKSRRRDPRALDYGTWTIVEPHTNTLVAGGKYGTMDLDAVEAWLTYDEGGLMAAGIRQRHRPDPKVRSGCSGRHARF